MISISAKTMILIGFSYSLEPDGSPGTYNDEIARLVNTDIENLIENSVEELWHGMQWEIYDALQKLSPDIFIPPSHVALPPDIDPEDIADFASFMALLKDSPTRATEIFCSELKNYLDGDQPIEELDINKLTKILNKILADQSFFDKFYEEENSAQINKKISVCRVELHGFYRNDLGSVGVERRTMPAPGASLGHYQAKRVNRLIMEAIFPHEGLLKKAKYLSTDDVINTLLPGLEKELPGIKENNRKCFVIYAHPKHRERCKRQLLEFALKADWTLDPEKILLGGSEATIDLETISGKKRVVLTPWDVDKTWDPNSAQMWCRSERNWEDYEAMGHTRLH